MRRTTRYTRHGRIDDFYGDRVNETVAYRGYLLRSNLVGDHWVEKDGTRIAWAEDFAAARAIVDSLLG